MHTIVPNLDRSMILLSVHAIKEMIGLLLVRLVDDSRTHEGAIWICNVTDDAKKDLLDKVYLSFWPN